jgi:hypothetical protein
MHSHLLFMALEFYFSLTTKDIVLEFKILITVSNFFANESCLHTMTLASKQMGIPRRSFLLGLIGSINIDYLRYLFVNLLLNFIQTL